MSTVSIETTISDRVPKLYNFLSTQDIDNIQKYFKNQKSAGLSYEKFRSLLARFNIAYSDEVFQNVLLKIDLDRDDVVNWSEFIAFCILELENDDDAKERLSIIPPIPKSANILSTTLQSFAVKINFDPALDEGRFITVGCYGDVNFWTTKWKLERTIRVDEIPVTSSRAIELSDKRQIKKSPKTLILDACNLSTFQIICVSSVCSDLRFYDYSTVGKCNLRLYIRNFPSPIVAIHFCCTNTTSSDSGKDSRLILGDMLGSVRVIDFMKNFKFRNGSMMRQISYQELMKGKHETIACIEYIKLHGDVIRQVSFVECLNSFVSASESVITKSAYLPSVIIGNLGIQETRTVFRMNSGTTCFVFDESSLTLATGGPDCILRLWNFIDPNRPKAILTGHTSGIMHIFMQDIAAKVYSMDKKMIIKIWDMKAETLLQTFAGLKTIFPNEIYVQALYNDNQREFYVASKKISSVKCEPKVNLNITDGYTHTSAVSVILFNKLFNFLVTCSISSTIIVWDVWKGRKVNLITPAHTKVVHGEVQALGISAGCFDPKHQFLLTASDDGTIKVWNFNEGICLRSVKIDGESRVSMVFWETQRIFAVGAKAISKFHDSKDSKMQITFGSTWAHWHRGEIVCAAVRDLDVIVTSCTRGDLIFWNFITGRPYLRFNITNPTQRLQVVYVEKLDEMRNKSSPEAKHTSSEKSQVISDFEYSEGDGRILAIAQCIISLNNRSVETSTGTFLVALSNGKIQSWSHHHRAESSITEFDAIHVAGDVITAMTTDTHTSYLFTGSKMGYIKTWMIVNFCCAIPLVNSGISQVKLREQFPLFRSGNDKEQLQESTTNYQLKPQLLNSYQGHQKSITGLLFFEKNQVLITSSVDKSVRLWNLSGQYIGTIGSPLNWRCLSPNKPPPHNYVYRMPADLKNVVSETTLRVLEGGNIANMMSSETQEDTSKKLRSSEMSDAAKLYQRIIRRPIVKKDTQKNDAQRRYEKPTLDISLTHIPVYSHLRIIPTVAINLPQAVPKCLETNTLPNLQYIFLEPDELKME